jgi:TonB family protein
VTDQHAPRFGLTPEEDQIYGAAYDASLIRTMGFWLLSAIGLTLVPFIGGGLFGLVLIVGMVLLFFAIPVRALRWRSRHATLSPDHPEMRKARLMIRHAILLWLLSPLAFIVAGLVSVLIHGAVPSRPVGSPTSPPAAQHVPESGAPADSPTSGVRRGGVHATDPELPRLGDYVYVEELPAPITKVPPTYPDLARSAGVEGTVNVLALVGKDGRVKDANVKTSIPMLDEAALQAVRQWTFRPATAKGDSIAVWVSVPVRFTLH